MFVLLTNSGANSFSRCKGLKKCVPVACLQTDCEVNSSFARIWNKNKQFIGRKIYICPYVHDTSSTSSIPWNYVKISKIRLTVHTKWPVFVNTGLDEIKMKYIYLLIKKKWNEQKKKQPVHHTAPNQTIHPLSAHTIFFAKPSNTLCDV